MWTVPAVAPGDVTFLSGAGISADTPTSGPIGNELAARTLTYAFIQGTMDEVSRVYRTVGVSRSFPRLEALLEIASRVHGANILKEILSDLASAQPNDLHKFFGQHLRRAGGHITANFDTLIESASPGVEVLHFHGRIDAADGDYGRLGAFLSRIERGFDEDTRNRLWSALTREQRGTLIVVGYSGLDYFDMDPFVVENAVKLSRVIRRVYWILHDPHADPGSIHPVADASAWAPMLRSLALAGIDCAVLRCRTVDFLNSLASQWGIPRIGEAGASTTQWRPQRELPEEAKAEAARRLYMHMGMYLSHRNLVDCFRYLRSNVSEADAAEIEWQSGHHRKALRHWRSLYAGTTAAMRARREERSAACLWDRGSYLRAYRRSRRAVAIARDANDDETIATCLETQARVLVHMGRVPDLRWIATSSRRLHVARTISSLLDSGSFGTHLRVRLEDVVSLLLADPERDGRAGPPSTVPPSGLRSDAFSQYESLGSYLDYSRGEQRRAISEGTRRMTLEWLNAYCAGAAALGKMAALATVPSLPGAPSILPPATALRLLLKASATPWHRLRLITYYFMKRWQQR